MNPARVALRHVRDEMGWPEARIPEVRPEPNGTVLAVVRVRDRGTGVRWTFGVLVARSGEVLDDAVLLYDRPEPSADEGETTITEGRDR